MTLNGKNFGAYHWVALIVAVVLTVALTPRFAAVQATPTHADVLYATVDGMELRLDIYMPDGVSNPPLLVFVHGGAWRRGSKARPPMDFVENGFALASLDFRQSTDARFPAMVHDIKAGIRFLRAKASEYGYRPERIAITGTSSGGHLVALVGVTNGHRKLEGDLGDYTNVSSDVQAIISYYGASDLTTILAQSTPFGLNVRAPALDLLLGGEPEARTFEDEPKAVQELAKLASPVLHVDASDPPLLLLHGDRDPQMPINQAHQLEGAYEKLGLDVYFDVVHGAAHGGAQFYEPEHLDRALAFLRRVIQ